MKNNIEEVLGVHFNDKKLLTEALTHSSYGNEHNMPYNERLEFLGDAVIELLMSQYLYLNSNISEGKMTKKRAQSVCEEALVKYASKINLSDYILLGHGEEMSNGRQRPAIIADCFEAVFGAIYLDQGYFVAQELFERLVIPHLDMLNDIKDYKSTLQEYVQSFKNTLTYELIDEKGPAHDKTYTVRVLMDGVVLGIGVGKTKKEAEQNAAKEALEKKVDIED